jgi:hypothetical protein
MPRAVHYSRETIQVLRGSLSFDQYQLGSVDSKSLETPHFEQLTPTLALRFGNSGLAFEKYHRINKL